MGKNPFRSAEILQAACLAPSIMPHSKSLKSHNLLRSVTWFKLQQVLFKICMPKMHWSGCPISYLLNKVTIVGLTALESCYLLLDNISFSLGWEQ